LRRGKRAEYEPLLLSHVELDRNIGDAIVERNLGGKVLGDRELD